MFNCIGLVPVVCNYCSEGIESEEECVNPCLSHVVHQACQQIWDTTRSNGESLAGRCSTCEGWNLESRPGNIKRAQLLSFAYGRSDAVASRKEPLRLTFGDDKVFPAQQDDQSDVELQPLLSAITQDVLSQPSITLYQWSCSGYLFRLFYVITLFLPLMDLLLIFCTCSSDTTIWRSVTNRLDEQKIVSQEDLMDDRGELGESGWERRTQ